MVKIKIAVIFGGVSTEHNVSIVSGTSIISNLDKTKYDIYPIYISRDGKFYKYNKMINKIKTLKIDEELDDIELIDNIKSYLKEMDVIFPVLHGKNGEDGTIQGMFEVLGKKYVGCDVLASSLCMDKVYAKTIFKAAGINVAPGINLKKVNSDYIYIDDEFNESLVTESEIKELIKEKLGYPVFLKPANQGSSVGVYKVNKETDLIEYLEESFKYDKKVLIEKSIQGREVECGILGNEKIMASTVGEVKSAEEFYSFDSKYKNNESFTVIPAKISDEVINRIKKIAKKAYKACSCRGLSRVDFFIEDKTNKIILNEINTFPGFTEISMYPKLMEYEGLSYSKLLDELIKYALEN